MVVEPGSLILHYKGRSDKCWYKEFEFTPAGNVLKVTNIIIWLTCFVGIN